MNFKIDVSRPPKQREILKELLKKKWCMLDKNTGLYTVHGIYEPELRVHDVFRYVIKIDDSRTVSLLRIVGTIGMWGDQYANGPRERPSIALIIESPHKHEYDYENGFKPVGPAQGPTGEKIDELLCELLQSKDALGLPAGYYDLLIVNPVQFQASLHRLHGLGLTGNSVVQGLRDRSWRAIYALEGPDFLKRMNCYRPWAVLMACTKKLQKKDVRPALVNWVRDWEGPVPGWPARPLLFEFSEHPQNWKEGVTTLQPVHVPQQPRP